MLPSTALVASALTLLATAPAPAEAAFDLRALGHHAHAALTQLSHLPEVVGFRQASGVISTTETTSAKRSLWARYYGDSRGFSRPKPLIERRGTIPTGWTEIGCVTEGTTSRTLNGLSYIDSGLTPEKCMTTCLARGFSLAGVEWSDECYCGQSFQGGGGAPGWSCDVPCKGDNSEMCGGYYFLNAYQYTAAPEQACNPTTAETPTPASSAAVSGASSAAASGASSAMAAASSGFTSIRASASAGASGIASASASASAAGPSASATAPGVTTEWEYQGCYWDNPADNNGLHLLQGTALTGQTNMCVFRGRFS